MPGKGLVVAAAGAVTAVLGLALAGGAVTDPPPAAGAPPGAIRPGVVPAPYGPLVDTAGQVCAAFPAPVIAAQLQQESGWNPDARSAAGAEGIAQFMPGTWRVWGRDDNHDGTASPFDPGDVIPAQARYDCALAATMTTALRAGTITGLSVTDAALAAYNAGPTTVLAAGGMPPIAETQHYVARIDDLARQYAGGTGGVPPTGTDFGAAVVAAAQPQLGIPYVLGGGDFTGPTTGIEPGVGFDCSGLVRYALFQGSGGRVQLDHLADDQARQGAAVTQGPGGSIDLAALQPGDIIGFRLGGSPVFDHIGIYAGDGVLLHASHPGADGGVKLEALTTGYWAAAYWTVRRFR